MGEEVKQMLIKHKQKFIDWKQHGGNYGLNVDYNELNDIAVKLGSEPFNIYCTDCRHSLLTFIYEHIKTI